MNDCGCIPCTSHFVHSSAWYPRCCPGVYANLPLHVPTTTAKRKQSKEQDGDQDIVFANLTRPQQGVVGIWAFLWFVTCVG